MVRSELVWTRLNRSQPVWTCLVRPELVWFGLNQSEPVWSSLNRSGPIKTGLTQSGPVKTGLNWSQPVWTSLDHLRPVWSGLNWSRLTWSGLDWSKPILTGLDWSKYYARNTFLEIACVVQSHFSCVNTFKVWINVSELINLHLLAWNCLLIALFIFALWLLVLCRDQPAKLWAYHIMMAIMSPEPFYDISCQRQTRRFWWLSTPPVANAYMMSFYKKVF